MLSVFALVFVLALAQGVHVDEEDVQWKAWKSYHGKTYTTQTEEAQRRAIWRNNLEIVKKHNAAGHSYTLAMNHFGDLTVNEFKYLFMGFMQGNSTKGATFLRSSNVQLPTTVDWRTKGYVTGVKNQKQCGSCWAFSTTGSLEGQHFKKTGKLVSLSEQNLVDCSTRYGNHGCQGGLMDNAFRVMSSSQINAKVVILGKTNSGKTCLMERYLHQRYAEYIEATIGAAYGTRTVDIRDKRITMGIWDTAGSERYDSMSRVYYRGAKAAIICYDLTDENSFHRAKYWINELHTYEEYCSIYLCGTKQDLINEKSRAVPAKTAKEYAEQVNAKFFETSSKTGHGVEGLFFNVAEGCIDNTDTKTANNNTSDDKIISFDKELKTTKKNCC